VAARRHADLRCRRHRLHGHERRRKRACKRTVPAGRLTFSSATAGSRSISFAGRLSTHKKLGYTVTISATNSSGRANAKGPHFKIVKS
jgi:hypothetical protein